MYEILGQISTFLFDKFLVPCFYYFFKTENVVRMKASTFLSLGKFIYIYLSHF